MTRDLFKAECKAAKQRMKWRYVPRLSKGVLKAVNGRLYDPRPDGWRRIS